MRRGLEGSLACRVSGPLTLRAANNKGAQGRRRVYAAAENRVNTLRLETEKQFANRKKRYGILTFRINEGRVFGVMRLRNGTSAAIQENRRKAVFLYRGIMDKPFKTIDEQIELIESRGMTTDENTPGILLREGYYSVINGYKAPFIDRTATATAGDDRYSPGSKFSDIYSLFRFDRALRLLLFGRFSIAEETLKTIASHCFSQAHTGEREPYLDPASYDAEKHQVTRLISDFETALGRNPRRQPKHKLYLQHYVSNHDEVPVWVIMKYMTLGQAFKFYCFQPESIRNDVAKTFSKLYASCHAKPIRISQRKLRLVYDHIKDFRNICAHDERLYCARVTPSSDTAIGDVVKELQLVLSKEEYVSFLADYLKMIPELARGIDPKIMAKVLNDMKMGPIMESFVVNE